MFHSRSMAKQWHRSRTLSCIGHLDKRKRKEKEHVLEGSHSTMLYGIAHILGTGSTYPWHRKITRYTTRVFNIVVGTVETAQEASPIVG